MKQLKISSYLLIVVSILKIALLYPLKELAKDINDMEILYSETRTKYSQITTFEDSIIYNSEFRLRTLGPKFSKDDLDSAIANNRLEAEQFIKEVETLHEERVELGRNYKLFSRIDELLNFLIIISGGLTIYYWVKLRK